MEGFADMGAIMKLLADPTRLGILTSLMDGRFHTVGELAKSVKVKSHTASYHLSKLEEMAWIRSHRQGRYVYYQLISAELATILEQLMVISPKVPTKSYSQGKVYDALKSGRSCYKHLAGELGIQLIEGMLSKRYLSWDNQQLILTERGISWLHELGIAVIPPHYKVIDWIKPCMDWTQRQFHIGGKLGQLLFEYMINMNYIEYGQINRSVCLTKEGKLFLLKLLRDE